MKIEDIQPTRVRAGEYEFICGSTLEVWRAQTVFTKEPGTIEWLKQVTSDDIIYDIGANIGLYTVMAATFGLGVYAFEPHVGNAMSLLRNIYANNVAEKVTLITAALHSEEGIVPFHYASLAVGSSGSQLGNKLLENGEEFEPEATEFKYAVSIDRLLELKVIEPANLIKVDVDGNELLVLQGMRHLLRSDTGPRSVQVEVHPRHYTMIDSFMVEECGYKLSHRHHTSRGAKLAEAKGGADQYFDQIVHNAVYVK